MARPTLTELSRNITMARPLDSGFSFVVDLEPEWVNWDLGSQQNPLDCSISYGSQLRPDPLNKKYPHECYNPKCGYILTFKELLDRNARVSNPSYLYDEYNNCVVKKSLIFYDYKTYKHLKQLWKCRHVRFLCCRCYDDLLTRKNVQEGMEL